MDLASDVSSPRERAAIRPGPFASAPFEAYVRRADEGRNSLARIVVAALLVAVLWFVGTALVLVTGGAVRLAMAPGGFDEALRNLDPASLLTGPAGVVTVLLSVAVLWPVVWLVVRLVHRRRLGGVLGAHGRLPSADFWRGFAAVLLVFGPFMLLPSPVEIGLRRSDLSLVQWLALLAPVAVFLLLQTSAEELLFRGYAMQTLAHRFRSPLVWAVLPLLAFTALHWDPVALPAMNAAGLVNIVALGGVMAWLVWRRGNLAAAMGVHFANNVVALQLVAADTDLGQVALFVSRSVQDHDWTAVDAAWVGLTGVVSSLLILPLMLHRRSPLRLPPAEPPLAPPAEAL